MNSFFVIFVILFSVTLSLPVQDDKDSKILATKQADLFEEKPRILGDDNADLVKNSERVKRQLNTRPKIKPSGVKKLNNKNLIRKNPIRSNPIRKNPSRKNPIRNNPIRNNPIRNNPIRKKPIRNNPIRKTPIRKTPIRKTPIKNNPIRNNPIRTNPIRNNPIRNNPINGIPTGIINSPESLPPNVESGRNIGVSFDFSRGGGSESAAQTSDDATNGGPSDTDDPQVDPPQKCPQ